MKEHQNEAYEILEEIVTERKIKMERETYEKLGTKLDYDETFIKCYCPEWCERKLYSQRSIRRLPKKAGGFRFVSKFWTNKIKRSIYNYGISDAIYNNMLEQKKQAVLRSEYKV